MFDFNQRIKTLNGKTSEEDFVSLIDELKITKLKFNNNLLVDLLSERNPLYKDRGSITSQRMRGYLIGAFQEIGTPNKALPYLLEELETSFYPYIVAASARAIRGLQDPHSGIASFLNKSIYNIWQGDAYVNYSSYTSPYTKQQAQTTAMWEIFESLSWMGAKAKYILPDLQYLEENLSEYLNQDNQNRLIACICKLEALENPEDDCCIIPNDIYGKADSNDTLGKQIDLAEIKLQDHDGIENTWNDYFLGRYTVLSFFYTRCHNPRKCIQTIYNLVDIQKSLKDLPLLSNVQTAAITYDPEFDSSEVLKKYGTNRRFQFNDSHKMFRVSEGMNQLIDQLNIGVNYKGKNVNVHRIEVYIINPEGKIEKSFLRFQATSNLIIEDLLELNGQVKKSTKNSVIKPIFNKTSNVFIPVFIAFFPKCPMCWAAYMNLLGISGLITIPHKPWLIYVFIGLAILNLWNLYRLAKKRNGMLPFYLATIGSLILGLNFWIDFGNQFLILGLIFTLFATLLNSLSFKKYHQFIRFFNESRIALKF